jgi:hypothetical protein
LNDKRNGRGIMRVDRAVEEQMGEGRGTDPESARNKQIEAQLKKAMGG